MSKIRCCRVRFPYSLRNFELCCRYHVADRMSNFIDLILLRLKYESRLIAESLLLIEGKEKILDDRVCLSQAVTRVAVQYWW